MTEHIGLLAAAHAFHAGLSRQAAVAAQDRAMEEPSTVRAGEEQHQLPSKPVPPGRQGGRDPAVSAPQTSAPAGSRSPPVDPLRPADQADPQAPGRARRPVLSVVDGGPALVRVEAIRLLEAADPQDPATPAVVVLGWLEAADRSWPPVAAATSCRPCWAWPARKAPPD